SPLEAVATRPQVSWGDGERPGELAPAVPCFPVAGKTVPAIQLHATTCERAIDRWRRRDIRLTSPPLRPDVPTRSAEGLQVGDQVPTLRGRNRPPGLWSKQVA